MTKMHGPDQDVIIAEYGNGRKQGMTLAELFKIIYDRLDNVRIVGITPTGRRMPLSELCDIESITQRCMVEVRKQLGLYKDDDRNEGLGAWTGGTTPAAPEQCNNWIRANKPSSVYPRYCERCGLGPCPFLKGNKP